MKKLLIALGVIVVLLVVVVVAAPFFIPVDTIRSELTKAARDATGRELAINGDFKLAVLPRFELEANDVTFSNAEWASEPNMASLKSLLIRLQILPLLSGQVKVDSFVLVDPVIHLEANDKGQGNWEIGGDKGAASSASGESGGGGSGAGGGADIADISLGEVRLDNGLVTFQDGQGGERVEISKINMTVDLPNLDSPFAADGAFTWNGEEIKVRIDGGSARGFMTGAETSLKVALTSNPVNLAYDGTAAAAGALKAGGKVDLNVPSIRGLAAWAGNPLDAPGKGLELLKINGQVAVDGQNYAFNNAKIQFDKMNADGDFSADLSGAKPYVKGRLNVDQIDLNDYMAEPAAGGSDTASSGGGSGGGGAQSQGWSSEPIDVSGLKAANADFDLTVGGILVQALKIGRSALKASLKDGLLQLDLTELALYNGDGQGAITVDARGAEPAIKKSFTLAGLQAEPFLKDAAGFERLEGTAEMRVDITAKGASQQAMVENLNGDGAVKFTDGAIKGINLAAMVRNVSSAFLDPTAQATQKTDFAELSGTYKITNGNLENNDLLLLSPLLRLNGTGTANIPLRTLNYRIEPRAVASTEGQGGDVAAEGLMVPVIIEGSWDNLSYRPDLTGVIEGVAKDPGKLLEDPEGAASDIIKGLTGGGSGSTSGSESGGEQSGEGDSGSTDPSKLLKGLFGD